MSQRNYPLHVMHGYVIPARDAGDFASLVERVDAEPLRSHRGRLVGPPSAARLRRRGARRDHPPGPAQGRRDLGARACARACSSSCSTPSSAPQDPLLAAARELNMLRSRAPATARNCAPGPTRSCSSTQLDETAEERAAAPRRLPARRHRLAGASRIIAASRRSTSSPTATFVGVDHPGPRLPGAGRHLPPRWASTRTSARSCARWSRPRCSTGPALLGAAMRVAYLDLGRDARRAAAHARCAAARTKLVLTLPPDLADLASERLRGAPASSSRELIGREAELRIGALTAAA